MTTDIQQRSDSSRTSADEPAHAAAFRNSSRYLLRFDDICPGMNWTVWDALEAQMLRLGVRPILAVVPDNQDPKLDVDTPRADFWERVRGWQAKGWTIALHGYQHVYVNKDPGLIGVTAQSEFAGLPAEVQEEKLRKGLAIFAAQGVKADAWVAPSHSFDETTVKILRKLGVTVISDGLGTWPYTSEGMVWVPQQLWSFQTKPAGVWTICNHHNSWNEQKVRWFEKMLEAYAPRMTDLTTVMEAFAGRERTVSDRWQAYRRLMWGFRIRPVLAGVFRKVAGPRPVSE